MHCALQMTAFSRPELPERDDIVQASIRKRARLLSIAAAVRRRQVAAAMQLLGGGQGPQGKKLRRRSRFSWTDHLLRLTESEFKLRYRLDFDAFSTLVRIIREDLKVSSETLVVLGARALWAAEPQT